MSSTNSRMNRSAKRRRIREERGESRVDRAASHDSCERSEHGEEIEDPFSSQVGFYKRAKRMAAKEWVKACESLMDQMEESRTTVADLSEEMCARCRELAPHGTVLAISLNIKSQYALREYSRRYLQALRDANSERQGKEETAKRSAEREEEIKRLVEEKRDAELERDQLRAALATSEAREEGLTRLAEEKKEAERERDQLRAALATREKESGREGGTPPRDTEPEEIEMREEVSPPPSGDVIVPAILGALEKWFGEKWDRMVAHRTSPTTMEESETTKTTAGSGSWARAAGRSAGGGILPGGGREEDPQPGGEW